MQNEARIVVGAPDGPRSTVWKFAARKADVYIFARPIASDAKISLHASGDCHWSRTDAWVQRDPNRRNQNRHMEQWHEPRPFAGPPLHCFQIRIPATDLRPIGNERNLAKIQWLPTPPADGVLSLECYITGPYDEDPSLTRPLPHERLFSFPLTDGRWFVVLWWIIDLNCFNFDDLRAYMLRDMRRNGFVPQPEHRAFVFSKSNGTARGIIELAMLDAE